MKQILQSHRWFTAPMKQACFIRALCGLLALIWIATTGSGNDLRKYWDSLRTGKIDNNEWEEIGKALSCGYGSCNNMGTASIMNGILEAPH